MNRSLSFVLPAAALLTACGGIGSLGPVTPAQPAGITAINGTVSGYSGGASTIKLLTDPGVAESASNPALTSATLNANGTFSLPLPSAAAVTPLLSPAGNQDFSPDTTCTGTTSSSTPDAQAYIIDTLNVGTTLLNSNTVVNVNTRTTGDFRIWLYVNKATTLSGSVSCPPSANLPITLTLTANAALVAGWNIVDINSVYFKGETKVSATLSTVNDQATTWIMVPSQAASLSLKAPAALNRLPQVFKSLLHF